ncbi:MAG: ribonucleoside triphosphate reductase [Bacillota bacterium]|nr:ribonucleoside triphosphate reductase [Bacillota bacterium]
MLQVVKRDGSIVKFNIKKIQNAIQKAFHSQQMEVDNDVLQLLSLRVTSNFSAEEIIDVEKIQDCVECTLASSGYFEVAKAYILYRHQHANVRQIEEATQDYRNIVDQYLQSGEEGKNNLETFSVGGFILSNSSSITKNYWLNSVYDPQIKLAHKSGDFYIHDLHMLTGDSAGWSLETLIKEGIKGVDQRIQTRPPKHLFTLTNMIVNFLGIMQNEWAGAQSISSFDTYLAPFVKKEQLSYDQVVNAVESCIYGLNIPSRWGTCQPFTSIALDWNCPKNMKDKKAIIGGEEQDFTYGECEKEMVILQKAILDVMIKGDYGQTGFPYPILSINIDKHFGWEESERNQLLFTLSGKYGSPYFVKNMDTKKKPANFSKLTTKKSGYYGYGDSMGSLGCVTINLPRLAYTCKSPNAFYKKLDDLLDLSARCLEIKREVLSKFLKSGLYPYTKHYINNFDSHFSTIGMMGFEELCQNAKWIQCSLKEKKAIDFTKEVLAHVQIKCISYQKQYKHYFNIEATPGEKACRYFVQKDKEQFPEISFKREYYSNSSIPVDDVNRDIFKELETQSILQSFYTGSTRFDISLEKGIENWKDCLNLTKMIVNNYNIPIFTISNLYSICPEHGYINGESFTCPICKAETKVYSRIYGYYQPKEREMKNSVFEIL